MAVATAIAVASLVITAVATAYQIIQAKKMKKAAERAAEARRGFEVPVEGTASNLPIVYGRAKVGGVRTFHATSSGFIYVTPNSDKIFQTGRNGAGAYSMTYFWWNALSDAAQNILSLANKNFGADPGGYLTYSQQAKKNEYLFFQQALCLGPINGIYDVIIDDSRFIDDTALGTYGYKESEESTGIKAAMRIDCHYNGGVADSIIAANFPERNTAYFTDMAYASAVIRLDRDDPQFSGVPSLQFLIEGRKVRTVDAAGQLSSTLVYSTNPAWCLLDYLMDPIAGKGLQVTELNLESFYKASLVCDTIVQTNVTVGGKFYQPTDGSRNIKFKDLPLYECNAIIDPEKPIRENIEALLSTMGDARLVWSSGEYSLNLQYPLSNEDIELAEAITDDDLILEQDVEINWPTGSEKFNNVIVKFHNEMENFKEDSASWPPKINDSYLRGIGSSRYSLANGEWDTSKAGGPLLANYGVWQGDSSSVSLTWLFKVDKGLNGVYSVKYTADDTMTITIYDNATDSVVFSGGGSDWKNLKTGSVSLGSSSQDKVYRVHITANDTGSGKENYKGVAAKIESSNRVLWTTRSATYSAFIPITYSSAVYEAMKAEDHGLELEADVFAEGITDYYHALAKAEELVRTSRSAVNVKFKYKVKEKYLEPGDFISLASETLDLGLSPNIMYLRVNSTKVDGEGNCEVQATRFDWTQLAWNVKDDVYYSSPELFSVKVPSPTNLVYSPASEDYLINNSGRLDWGAVEFTDFGGYILYKYDPVSDPVDVYGLPVFVEIGRTKEQFFIVPPLNCASAVFGVRAVTKSGKISDITTTGMTEAIVLSHPWLRNVTLTSNADNFVRSGQNEVTPASITFTATPYHFTDPVYSWEVDGAVQTETSNTFVLNAFSNRPTSTVKVIVKENGGDQSYSASKLIGYGELVKYPINAYLTRSSFNLFAYSDGIIESTDDAFGYVVVTKGDEIVTDTDNVLITMTATGCVATCNTVDGEPTGGEPKGYYKILNMPDSINGRLDFSITYTDPSTLESSTFNLSVEVAKLVVGFQIFESALPTTDNVDGRVVYLRSEKKLYRYDASLNNGAGGWVPVVNTVDLSGQIQAGQIAEEAISELELTGTLASRIDLVDNPITGLVTQFSDLQALYGETANAAQSAIDAAQSASDAALSEAAALLAKQGAETASASAVTAKTEAQTAASSASVSATNAANSATSAAGSASTASTQATTAANSATAAGNSASAAATSATNAATSATAAGNSATSASASAVTAASEANDANDSAVAASSSASIATTKATEASQSATSASQSATTATTKAGEASTSATNAATSETNAAGSASTATTEAGLAATSATNAANSATAAATSATTASTKATEASQSATTASTSAATATTKAGEASTSASAAATSATNAAGSASSAGTSATNAASSATLAGDKATAASTSASQAATSATNAATSATTATTQANTATTKAGEASTSASQAAQSATDAQGYATAAAQDYTTVTARLNNAGGTGVTVEQSLSSNASDITGLKGQYSVKIDNNGHVSGFGLSSSAVNGTPTSAFIIRADKFAIVDPASTSDNLTNTPSAGSLPFYVDSGVTYIKNAMIKDGSIDNAKIGSLNASKINAGTIAVDRLDGGNIKAAILNTTEVISLAAQIKDATVETLKIAGEAVSTISTYNTSYTADNPQKVFPITFNMAHPGTWAIIVSMEIYGSTYATIYSSVTIEDGLNFGGLGAQGVLALGTRSLQANGTTATAGLITKNLTLASYWYNYSTNQWVTTPTGSNAGITGASFIANIIRTYR